MASALRRLVRDDLYHAFDDKGGCLETRRNSTSEEAIRRQRIATFAIGRTKGFAPYRASEVANYLRGTGTSRAELVAVGRERWNADKIAARFELAHDVYDLRYACARTFYASGRTAESV